jgi:uncharacterized protein (TIGR00159 family)
MAFISTFIQIRFLDVLDVFLVAFLLYELYSLIRGTSAMQIFIGIVIIYLLWLLVRAMKMELLSSIMGQVIGVGVIALIVVFQQEIRKFLLILGNKYFKRGKLVFLKNAKMQGGYSAASIDKISRAAIEMAKTKTGALIVITMGASMKTFAEYGEIINADINIQLLKAIFYKDAPLHDGAVLIENDKIFAAKCVLPVSSNPDLPAEYGLRHRSALGMSEVTDTITIVVSEQTGNISVAHNAKIYKLSQPEERLNKMISGFLSRE